MAAAFRTHTVVLAILILVLPALGQGRPVPGFEEVLRPDVVRRDLEVYADTLSLDDGQEVILRELFEDYDEAAREIVAELRTKVPGVVPLDAETINRDREEFRERMTALMQELRQRQAALPEGADPTALQQEFKTRMNELRGLLHADNVVDPSRVREQMLEFADQTAEIMQRKADIKSEFDSSVKAILSVEQSARWPDLERRLMRLHQLDKGRFSGESVDLRTIVTRLDLDRATTARLEDALLAWEIDLHDALAARKALMADTRADMVVALQGQDVETGRAVADRRSRARVVVRDVNDRHAEIIGELLEGEDRERFLTMVRQRGYARVYRPTSAARMFEAAKRLDDADATVLEAVAALEAAYLEELASHNAQLYQLIRLHEPDDARRRLERQFNRAAGKAAAAQNDPLRAAYMARRELGERYLDQLRGTLTTEQYERLPGRGGSRRSRAGT